MASKNSRGKSKPIAPSAQVNAKPRPRTNEAYKHLFDNMLEGYAYCQIVREDGQPTDFIYLEVNKAFKKLMGLKNVTGQKVSQVIPGLRESNPELLEIYGRVAMTGIPEKFETFVQPLGTWFAIGVYSPEKEFFVAVFENISQRKQAENAYWEAEERYRALAETDDDVILLTDLNGKQLFRNKAYYSSLGYSENERLEVDGYARVHPDDISALRSGLGELLAKGVYQSEYRIMHRDGHWLHRLARSTVIYDKTHQPQSVMTIVRDVTQSKLAESALQRSQTQMADILTSAMDAIISIDGQQRIVLFNQAAEKMFQCTQVEAMGQSIERFLPTRFRRSHEKHLETFMRFGTTNRSMGQFGTIYGLRADGVEFPIEASISKSHGAETDLYTVILRDVTERKEAEAAAEFSERRFRALIENSAEAITLLDAAGAVTYDSPAAPRMLGYGPQEWIGKNVFELIHPDDLFTVQDMFQKLVTTPGGRSSMALRLRHKNSSWVWIDAVATNLLTEPSVLAIVVNYRDITERKLTEERIQRHAQHLTSLHEIDRAIASSFDIRTSLDILLEQVTLQLDVDAASVLLLDPFTNTLEYAAQRGFRRNTAMQNASIPLGESFAGRAALDRKMIQAHGSVIVQENPYFAALWREESFQSYFVVPLVAKGHVKGVMEVFDRAPLTATPDWMDFLYTLGGQAAIAIDNAQLFENLQHANMDLSLAYDATIEGWSYALDLRDKETEGHSLRVTQMTLRLAEVIGIGKSEIIHIRRGALLHDIGKMGIPDQILLKPDALSPEEWTLMKQHPVFAYNMLSRIAYLRPAIDIPYCHHEKWDGSGYPRGLKGEEIPLAARLFAIVDVWDALRSNRTYRPGWPRDKALEYIREQAGKHFDPQVVDGFMSMQQKYASTEDSA